MTGKERIACVLNGGTPDRNGFWMGDLHIDSRQIYYDYFNVSDDVELAQRLGSDIVWRHADKGAWRTADKSMLFGELINPERNQSYAWLANCEDAAEVDNLEMPDLSNFDFTELEQLADHAHDAGLAFFSGMWAPFFHIVADSFGMENYFIKMYESPEVVEALTEKVLTFYLAANRLCFEHMAGKLDAYFFGNDLGSQLDLLISPDCFRRFVLPGITRLTALAKEYGLKVVMHSCGAVYRVIPELIGAGVDVLHPIQAKAANMDAQTLQRDYSGRLRFMGGIDAQELLPFGKPEEVEAEVRRISNIMGTGLIVSPSHEKILPNIPPQNIEAMARAVGAIEGDAQ